MSRGKSILLICCSLLLVLLCFCCVDSLENYKLTEQYGDRFAPEWRITCPHSPGDFDYYKVVSYDGVNAQVYYVDSDGCEGLLIEMRFENGRWKARNVFDISWEKEGAISEYSGLCYCLGNYYLL